jgi:ABC-2 type transport system ATP-binding protein
MQEKIIQIKNLKKEFPSLSYKKRAKRALKGVSLDIYQGETLALLGTNGAGKTTLSSILATLKAATSGEILFKGEPLANKLLEYRFILGFCPQKSNLNPLLSMRDNLLFSAKYYGLSTEASTKRVDSLIKSFDLVGYETKYTHELSGGYRQRFLLARALVHDPEIVILDEPTVALDPHIRRQLWDIITDLKKMGKTIIITTHYLDEADILADRVCILDKGQIKLIDTPEKLKKRFEKENLEAVFLQLLKEDTE